MGGGGETYWVKGCPPCQGEVEIREPHTVLDKCLCCIFLSPIYSHAQYQM